MSLGTAAAGTVILLFRTSHRNMLCCYRPLYDRNRQSEESEWYLVDSDAGRVIPIIIGDAENVPGSVLTFDWSEAARSNWFDLADGPENEIHYEGAESRYARECPSEKIACVLMWSVPPVVILPLLFPVIFHCILIHWRAA